ncbi:LamG domain-containing protein [Streptomyces clavuligerus]|uniref:LamG domain-containing protein n=5 Tax=Streptomyces clavuligerus TaxID=1901 RepID=UPI00020D94E1|nr:LamG domain-containing protein [Streptomyces clavuligerus]
MARHQGTALAFAMDDQRRIVYTVLDLSTFDEKRGELDAAYWSENPALLPFPNEIVKTGFAVAGATAMPTVKAGGRVEAGADEVLEPEEIDSFLSTTARLTADAPFQVLSDGTHVVVLRQAIGAGHADAVFPLASGSGSSGDSSRTDLALSAGGAAVPVVADTLLCDRFLLVGGVLKPTSEVRFKRSRHKTEPASAKDSLGAADMDGVRFHEPTQELAFVRNLTGGRFTALLVPTSVQSVQRWQFFAHNSVTGRIDCFSVEQAADGLFNTQGTRYWTSPDPKYRGTVFERQPGICPFTSRALVPVLPEGRFGESALRFNGTDAGVEAAGSPVDFTGPYTLEAWIRPGAAGGPVAARGAGAGQGFRLTVTSGGVLEVAHDAHTLTTRQTLAADTYAHVAVSFDGTTASLYLNGDCWASGSLAPPTTAGAGGLRIGSVAGGGFFTGVIDEVRVWDRVRSQSETGQERGYRLVGNESGLAGYYRFDEGSGTTAFDQSDSAAHATLTATTAWVTSEAPVGDHPGVRRDSFTLAGREVVSALSSMLYYQQEEAPSGYGGAVKPVKRQARVLLACATRPAGSTTADEAHVATVDFGVGTDGRLASLPDVVTLEEIGRPQSETSDKVSAQLGKTTGLEHDIDRLQVLIAALTTEKASLEAEIAAANASAATDPGRWAVIVRSFESGFEGILYDRWYDYGVSVLAVSAQTPSYPEFAWHLMPLPYAGVAHGNPVCALVRVRDGLVAEYVDEGDRRLVRLRPHSLTDPLPLTAQWHVSGDRGSHARLQNAFSSEWLGRLAWLEPDEDSVYTITWELIKCGNAPDPFLAVKQARLDAVVAEIAQHTAELAGKRAELVAAREELARLTAGLLGAADLVLPVPHLAVDANGLSSAGAVLMFARTGSAPYLADSAMGRVALYFQGANGQFFAAYLDTTAVRDTQVLAGQGATLRFTARDPGVALGGTRVSVSPFAVNGTAVAELCEVTITRTGQSGAETETFPALPRRAADLAAALSGRPDEPVLVGTVTAAAGAEVTLAKAVTVAVPAWTRLRIGDTVHLLAQDAAVGAAVLHLAQAPAALPTPGTKVVSVRYDTSRATSSRPGVLLDAGSRWVTVTTDTDDERVADGTATVGPAVGHGSRWRGDSPGRAFAFDGTAQYLSLPAVLLDQVTTAAGDVTAEAWINPTEVPGTGAQILHVNRATTRAALALADAPVSGGVRLDGVDDWIAISGADLTYRGSFTIECWIKRTAGRNVDEGVLGSDLSQLNIGFTASGAFTFSVSGQALTTATNYPDADWHHWAVTFDRTTMIQTSVRDGVEVARRTATALPQGGNTNLIVGRSALSYPFNYFAGQVAELRTWSTARSAADIGADMNRRISTAEPGLDGAWIFDSTRPPASRFAALGPVGRSAVSWDGGALAGAGSTSPAAVDSPLKGYRILAAFGDKVRRSRDLYTCEEWAHLAAVYEQSWALRFDGNAWAETPDADQLDITGDLTLEVFATLDETGTRQGLISKGALGDGDGGTLPYQLSVLPGGKLEFAFEEPGPVVHRFTSSSSIGTGFHRIAVVRRSGSTTTEKKKQITFKSVDESGNPKNETVDVVDHVDVDKWSDITFRVDGQDFGTTRYTGTGSRGNAGTLEIGRARDGSSAYGLTGTVGEVRIWGRARDTDQLGTPLNPRDEGLIARWTFEENEGNTTADPAGGHDLKLRRAKWTTDPDPLASSFTVYRNGRPIACDIPTDKPLGDSWGDDQLTLGALSTSGTYGGFFKGTLEEVRLWRTPRTPEQILDSLFTRLKGDKQDLLGYWPFDAASTTPDADAVRDQSLRGNHLAPGTDTTRPQTTLSTAPVSTDTAMVRSALGGIRTPFHETITAPPAATEYADLQYTPDGQMQGVLKRTYTHINDGTWHLTTGYKVGDLITEWVSQIQYDPQLIGYIEGAPPVPSENLTLGGTDYTDYTDYTGASQVTFQQADDITSTLSSSSERSVDTAFSFAAGVEVDEGILLITAPLGIGTAEPIATVAVKAHVGGNLEFSNAWTSETTVSQGTTTERDTTATLTGYPEDDQHPLNPDLGRRWIPNNTGYALVQSETADVYALRLAHTGTLVAYRMLPNPDIPKDWNIITFPLNPQYTKQGTLDGGVGFTDQGGKVFDKAYPNASGYGEYSYFKPREAYALKRRIQRERQELENYYNTVSTETSASDPTADRAGKILAQVVGSTPTAPDKNAPTESAGSFANRNIANTYVWTADGGFFAETTSTVDVVTQTTGGSYTVSGAVTGHVEATFEVAGIGAGFQLDASIGGGTTVTRHRSRQATRSHSLDITVNPGRDLQKRDKDSKPLYDQSGKPVLTPGKVDAYRFMTFYLGQDTTNFDDFYNKVIDPTWLTDSTEASANALRQAQQSDTKPPCWRILHRVTYLSRILPPIPTTAPPSLEKDLHALDIPSNYELIRLLDPYVRTAATDTAALADATRNALTTHLPQLLPHAAQISHFLAAYYGLDE